MDETTDNADRLYNPNIPICPLLFDPDEGIAMNCQGNFCAWAIEVGGVYRCAIAEIATRLK